MKIFELETENSGNDDILVGENFQEVLLEVFDYFNIESLPEKWELRELTMEEYQDTWEQLQHISYAHEKVVELVG